MALRVSWDLTRSGFSESSIRPDEAEFPLAVENEGVRGGYGAVCLGDLLRIAIVKVGEMEVMVLGPDLHFLEAIAQVRVAQFVQSDRLRAVGRDGHESDFLILVVRGKLLDAALVGLGRGAVIAGENHDQDLRLAERVQAVGLAVHAGQAEIGRRAADLQRGGMAVSAPLEAVVAAENSPKTMRKVALRNMDFLLGKGIVQAKSIR